MTSTTQAHEFKAKSVEDAIAEGLKTLKVTRAQVEITVVHKGSRGILGFGSEPAVVHITLRAQPAAQPTNAVNSAINTATATPVTTPPLPTAPVPAAVIQTETALETESKFAAQTLANAQGVETEAEPEAGAEAMVEDVIRSAALLVDNQPNMADLTQESGHVGEHSDAEHLEENSDELEPLAIDLLDNLLRLMGFEAEIVASWQDDDQMEDLGGEEQEASKSKRYLLLDVRGADLGALIGRRGETLDNLQYLLRLMVNQRLHKWKNIVVDVEQYKARRVTQLSQLAQRMAEQVSRSGRAVSLEPMPPNERRIVHMTLRDHPKVYTESIGDGIRRKVHIFAKN